MKLQMILLGIVLMWTSAHATEKEVSATLDRFHMAASKANFSLYFDQLTEDAIFLGTDPTEKWTKHAFQAYVKPYFDKGQGWTYTMQNREIYFSKDKKIAWFDELVQNDYYGPCRGTGVLKKIKGQWKIAHYSLSMLVTNQYAPAVIDIINK